MIVVTGGAGFIGSAFVWKLNTEGIDDVVIVDRLGCSGKWKNLVTRRYADFLHKDAFLQMIQADRLPFPVEILVHPALSGINVNICPAGGTRNALEVPAAINEHDPVVGRSS